MITDKLNFTQLEIINKLDELSAQLTHFSEQGRSLKGCDSAHLRIKLTSIMIEVLQFIENDDRDCSSTSNWGQRYLKIQNVSFKLKKLLQKVSKCAIDLTHDDLSTLLTQTIDQHIQYLGEKAFIEQEIPENYGDLLSGYRHFSIKSQDSSKQTEWANHLVDKGTFHALAKDIHISQEMVQDDLEGYSPCRALALFKELVKEALERSVRKDDLVLALEQTTALAVKISSAHSYFPNEEGLPSLLEQLAFSPFSSSSESSEEKEDTDHDSSSSSDRLEEGSEMRCVSCLSLADKAMMIKPIVDEAALEVERSIQALRDKGFLFVPLWTPEHFVLAKVECRLVLGVKQFDYLLFNTGEGYRKYHQTERHHGIQHVMPLKIEGISIHGLGFAFWKKAFLSTLCSRTIDPLYALQKHSLINYGKGKKSTVPGSFSFPVQKYGTCAFSAVEMALWSHLRESERVKLRYSKVSYAVREQIQTVQYRKRQLRQTADREKRADMIRKLHQSEALLQQSRASLKEASKELAQLKAKGSAPHQLRIYK